nr:isochorismatase family cysteine hydrolase [Acidilobus saccharovorans]
MRPALVIVDMLNDFIDGALATPEAKATVAPARKVLEAFRRNGWPVIYVNDAHYPTDIEMPLWGPHAMKGTRGAEVYSELAPREGEYVLEKHAYSGFFGTALDHILRSLGVDTVVLVGLDADICVRHTAADAFFRGYKVVVVRDAVAARIDKNWETYYKKVYGATVLNSDEVESYLRSAQPITAR